MKITKLGHCCLIIEINGVRFLTDPGNYTTAQDDVVGIDAVVISHEHTDHLHIESLKKVLINNPTALVICNTSVGKMLDREGISYSAVAHGQQTVVKGVTISGHGTVHHVVYRDYELVENTGYLFGEKLFYPGDAFYDPQVPVDILAFPIGAPWCSIAESIDYVLTVKPRIAFPVHDGNLIRHGLTTRLPALKFSEAGITALTLELGKETEV